MVLGLGWVISGYSQTPVVPGERAAMPSLRVRGGERGATAIESLGADLPKVAAHYRKAENELRGMFQRDRSLRLDREGRLVYNCEGLVAPVVSGEVSTNPSPAALAPLAQTFFLHSKSNSNRKIFLDFDGHGMTNNAWTVSYNGGTNFYAPAWDTDGNPASFSSTEQTAIQQIWLRVAEDYAAFDVDVTTEFPGEAALTRTSSGDSLFGMRALVSPISSYVGAYGGIAYVGVFDNTGDYYKPALIFPERLGNSEKNIAEAISHEVGHTLGLSHDGTTNGVEYYTGQGNWAPIMGVGYSKPIVHWSRGEYVAANNPENDFTVILQNGLTYRNDDFGNATSSAFAMSGLNYTNAGIIERTNDVDFLKFTSSGGSGVFTVTPWERGANVHFLLSLYDASGVLVTNREVADTTGGVQPVVIQRNLTAGNYFVSIEGIGSGNPAGTGYSDFGSVGNYTFRMNLAAPSSVAVNPTNLVLTLVSNTLQISWPADHIGWRLEAQTNAIGKGVGTNWGNVAGATATNRMFFPLIKTNGVVLFRLAYP